MRSDGGAVPFQTCGLCKCAWATLEGFVVDPDVRLLGLQAVTNPEFNVLVFEHRCGGSISILTRRLRHLDAEAEPDAPRPALMDTDQCRGHCRLLEDLESCDAPCANARDRRLIQLVERMKKEAQPTR